MEWRAVPGFEGRYEVSDDGQVRSWLRSGLRAADRATTPALLSPHATPNGLRVNLVRYTAGGTRVMRSVFVHRLVLLAFVGPCPSGKEVRRWSNDPADNRLVNLYWGPRAPGRDTDRHGRLLRGESVHSAKLTADAVRAMRTLRAEQPMLKLEDIASRFGVSQGTASKVLAGKSWKHV